MSWQQFAANVINRVYDPMAQLQRTTASLAGNVVPNTVVDLSPITPWQLMPDLKPRLRVPPAAEDALPDLAKVGRWLIVGGVVVAAVLVVPPVARAVTAVAR